MFKFTSAIAIFAGLVMIVTGSWGIFFTYKNVTRELIVTPADASIPNTPVRGPFTLKSQADIIRVHTLRSTNGQTFAEMPRLIPKTDESGEVVLDENGESILVPNTARDIWITATSLITALNLAIVTYAFSSLIIFFGLISIWTGFVFSVIGRKKD